VFSLVVVDLTWFISAYFMLFTSRFVVFKAVMMFMTFQIYLKLSRGVEEYESQYRECKALIESIRTTRIVVASISGIILSVLLNLSPNVVSTWTGNPLMQDLKATLLIVFAVESLLRMILMSNKLKDQDWTSTLWRKKMKRVLLKLVEGLYPVVAYVIVSCLSVLFTCVMLTMLPIGAFLIMFENTNLMKDAHHVLVEQSLSQILFNLVLYGIIWGVALPIVVIFLALFCVFGYVILIVFISIALLFYPFQQIANVYIIVRYLLYGDELEASTESDGGENRNPLTSAVIHVKQLHGTSIIIPGNYITAYVNDLMSESSIPPDEDILNTLNASWDGVVLHMKSSAEGLRVAKELHDVHNKTVLSKILH
jgi:hypothetical protein